jgi:predicted TPR repeat methyltransferase
VTSALQTAAGLHQAGRLGEAAALYRQILEGSPKSFEALYALGIISAQQGDFEQGQQLLGEAAAANPSFAELWCVRGVLLSRLRRADEALACFDRALALKPDYREAITGRIDALADRPAEALEAVDRMLALQPGDAIAWNNRGGILVRLGRLAEALASFERAVSLKPDFLEALVNSGTMLVEMKRPEEAVKAMDAALAIDNSVAAAWNNRGNALLAMKRFEEAIESYDKALALRPGFPQAEDNRASALLELKRGTRCPPSYLRTLFDDFSADYDRKMLENLGYRGHLHLRALAEGVLPRLTPPWRILDLGSGTGLVGEAFKDLAAGGRLDGIDIAPLMIEAARARGVYDELILGDLETVLAAPGPRYDLILAADTMIYLGDLAPAFWGVANRLDAGGFYLFAVEAKDETGWEHNEWKRFCHSEGYLREEAARAGLIFIDIMECVLRRQAHEPVRGFAVALQKPPG